MRFNIATSIVMLLLASFAVGGGTVAWFTTQTAHNSTFSTGTVKISEPQGSQSQEGTNYTMSWGIQNTGTKTSYIRALLNQDWNVQAETTRVYSEGQTSEIFVLYVKGQNPQPVKVDLRTLINGNPVGSILAEALVWDEGDTIYFELSAANLNRFSTIWICAALAPHGSWSPETHWFRHLRYEGDTQVFSYSLNTVHDRFNQDRIVPMPADGTTLYIAIRADMQAVTGVTSPVLGQECSSNWIPGNGGWWYYGTSAGPTILPPGQVANICFSFSANISGSAEFSLEAEAVQTTHGAINYTWPDNPFD